MLVARNTQLDAGNKQLAARNMMLVARNKLRWCKRGIRLCARSLWHAADLSARVDSSVLHTPVLDGLAMYCRVALLGT